MLKKLFTPQPKKEDICPNCGTACFATDIICLNCGENLDDLFEQLPDLEQSESIFGVTSRRLPFLTWFTPLMVMFSSFIVSLVTTLPFALHARTFPDRGPLQLIWYVVPHATFVSSSFLLISAIPLFLCTTRPVRAKLSHLLVVILATLLSGLSVIALWSELPLANIMAMHFSFAFFGMEVFGGSAKWINIVSAGGTLLIALNLISIIGQKKTA